VSDEVDRRRSTPEPGGQTLSQTSQQKAIMVVDDSQTVRNIMALIVHRLGHRTIRAASAMEGLTLLTESVPDLIFLDVTLPGMDGLDVCKVIKNTRHTKHVPVIMLSGNDQVFDKVMGRLAGASDYITKPFEPETIRKCLETYCGQNDRVGEGLWQKPR
jgi:twitching motility two-component system response regulator PilG